MTRFPFKSGFQQEAAPHPCRSGSLGRIEVRLRDCHDISGGAKTCADAPNGPSRAFLYLARSIPRRTSAIDGGNMLRQIRQLPNSTDSQTSFVSCDPSAQEAVACSIRTMRRDAWHCSFRRPAPFIGPVDPPPRCWSCADFRPAARADPQPRPALRVLPATSRKTPAPARP